MMSLDLSTAVSLKENTHFPDTALSNLMFTYQTRPIISDEAFAALTDYAKLFGKVERSLFKAYQHHERNYLKRFFLEKFQITGRQFNAIWISLKGKIDSAKENTVNNIANLTDKIAKLEKK